MLGDAGGYNCWDTGRGIFHNKDKTFLTWVNEEDHFRFISMQMGGNLGQIYKRLVSVSTQIMSLPFRIGTWETYCFCRGHLSRHTQNPVSSVTLTMCKISLMKLHTNNLTNIRVRLRAECKKGNSGLPIFGVMAFETENRFCDLIVSAL